MTAAEQAELADLGRHWGDSYAISLCDGTWTAYPYDCPSELLTAASAAELRDLIRRTYRGRPYDGCSL